MHYFPVSLEEIKVKKELCKMGQGKHSVFLLKDSVRSLGMQPFVHSGIVHKILEVH